MIKRALALVVDQAVLSAVNFGMSALFIYRGSPSEFALYSAYMSAFYFVATAQNALLSTPMMVLTSRMSDRERGTFERGLFSLLMVGGVPVCLVVVLGLKALTPRAGGSATAALCVGIALVPLMLRDHLRAQEFSNLRPEIALKRDLAFAAAAVAGAAAAVAWLSVTAVNGIAILGAACLLVVTSAVWHWFQSSPRATDMGFAWQRSWHHSLWSLAGALASWFQSYAYVFVPLHFGQIGNVAGLSAARLAIMPVLLATQSWGNLFRPTASRLVAAGDETELRRLFWKSTGALAAIVLAYTVAVALILPVLPLRLLPAPYRGIAPMVLLWGGIVLIQVVRGNISSVLQAALAFRRLTWFGIGSAVTTVTVSIAVVPRYGAAGALVGLVAGELVLFCSLGIELHRRMSAQSLAVVA